MGMHLWMEMLMSPSYLTRPAFMLTTNVRVLAAVIFGSVPSVADCQTDELGVWRQPWNKIKAPYRDSYYKYFPRSEPEEDFDDRNLLYATRVNILDSILYRGESSYRQMYVLNSKSLGENAKCFTRLIDSMGELVAKFPEDYEENKN